jgi:hypothetical protein
MSLVLRLVTVVGCLYLNLNHDMSTFSFSLDHQRSSNSLLYSTHSHISISDVSILSLSQRQHYRLNHIRIYFMGNNEFGKTN